MKKIIKRILSAILCAAALTTAAAAYEPVNIRLNLAQGIALALEFKMGGEVLRTVVVREWSELGILGAIIVLRAMLTFLIHWEIRNEKKEQQEERKLQEAEKVQS